MNAFEKFRYLGPMQTARKYALKLEHAINCRRPPPSLPLPDQGIELRLTLLGHEFDLSRPDRWHYSPDTGQVWPMKYGPAMPLDIAGDVKLVWELNRHQFLPSLDKELARRLVRDWIAQNPYPFGINWSSVLEAALRLIAWRETFGPHEFTEAQAQHRRYIDHFLSSDWVRRGNHLVGEAAGLSVYDGTPHRWLRQAAGEQFYADGVHCEQSVAYHHFVTHLFSVAGLPQSPALAYLGAIRQPDGTLPDIGDNDDGRASTPNLELPPAPAGSVAFPDAGHYVIREGGDYCFVRCGEFGLSPNYSHGHSDLLCPVLWLGGVPVLVDSGTFTYNGDPQWRRYFRSAAAHNGLTIDEQDWAEQAGTFAWHNPLRGICEAWTGTMFQGVVGPWRRRIEYLQGEFNIMDAVQGGGRHRLRWRFHLHPHRRVTRCAENSFEIDDQFRLTAPGELRVASGWFAPSYGVRVPTQVCEISMDTELPAKALFCFI